MRTSDTVSRLGGDEFVILLSELETAEDAGIVAKKIISALAMPHRIGQHDLHVTASIGLAIYPVDDGKDAETLAQKSADTALYQAQEQRAEQVQVHSAQEMNVRAIVGANRGRGPAAARWKRKSFSCTTSLR